MGRLEIFRWVCLIPVFFCVGISRAQVKPFFIDCGSNSTVNAAGRIWVGDSSDNGNVSLSYRGSVATVSDGKGDSSVYGDLYRSVRLFNMTSNYSFGSVLPGNYFIRLHFHLFSVAGADAGASAFGITANDFKLVATNHNFSDEIARRSNGTSLIKEYFLNVSSINGLWIEFVPASGSFAFVNAIEVIPIAGKLFLNSGRGMETMYRVNVGGPEIESNQDDDGLWRKWEQDALYMYEANTGNVIENTSAISYANGSNPTIAPILVYADARITSSPSVLKSTLNVSWNFDVDPGFQYLLRLHFCELVYDNAGQRFFTIYIDFKTADDGFDVFARAGGKNKAYHEDYVVASSEIKTLWVQLGPVYLGSASDTRAILSGLEIFKISLDGTLGNDQTDGGGVFGSDKKGAKNIGLVIAVGVLTAIVFLGLCFVFFRSCNKNRNQKPETSTRIRSPNPGTDTVSGAKPSPQWRPLVLYDSGGSTTADPSASGNRPSPSSAIRVGRRFTITEIRSATRDFDESLIIGTGGFGKVYKAVIEEYVPVAVKRAHPHSEQGLAEFETEIEMLSKLRHRHLVSMIGYCDEQREMILVYEYMANGTLRSHLYGTDQPHLSWKQRVEACIGAARGLHYLHTGGADRGIIHRDVKTTNILLDGEFVAKMADFGLSKTGPPVDHSHVSTAVRGSFGYLDPEYFRRQKLTQKSDVYSFGVVLFEVVCARAVMDPTLPKDQINLAEWAARWQREGSLETIIDRRLQADDNSHESLTIFGEIAEKCLADDGRSRPTMAEVLWHLETVLRLQESYLRALSGESSDEGDIHEMRSTSIGHPLPPPRLSLISEEDEEVYPPEPARLEKSSLLSLDSLSRSTHNEPS